MVLGPHELVAQLPPAFDALECPSWPQPQHEHLSLTKDERQVYCELFRNQPILLRRSNKTTTATHSLSNLIHCTEEALLDESPG